MRDVEASAFDIKGGIPLSHLRHTDDIALVEGSKEAYD